MGFYIANLVLIVIISFALIIHSYKMFVARESWLAYVLSIFVISVAMTRGILYVTDVHIEQKRQALMETCCEYAKGDGPVNPPNGPTRMETTQGIYTPNPDQHQ